MTTRLFYGFFENFINCSQYPSSSNVYSDLPFYRHLPSIKDYSRQYKICTLPNMKPLREIKMPTWNEYLCFWTDTFTTMIRSISFSQGFTCCKGLPQHNGYINIYKLVSNGHLAVSPDNLKEIKYIDSFLPQSVTQETQHLCQV